MAEAMKFNIELKDLRSAVEGATADAIDEALDAMAAEYVSNAKLYTPVDTGRLQDSIRSHVVDAHTREIGTDVEYAVKVELGDYMNHTYGKAHYMRDAGQDFIDDYLNIAKEHLSK